VFERVGDAGPEAVVHRAIDANRQRRRDSGHAALYLRLEGQRQRILDRRARQRGPRQESARHRQGRTVCTHHDSSCLDPLSLLPKLHSAASGARGESTVAVFRDPALRTLRPRLLVLLFATAWAAVHPLGAQELEPRAYSASPVGMTFLVIGAGRSSGSVLIDPSLPLDDVRARLGVATVGIGRTFDLASRTALVVVAVPYARARLSGQLGAERADAQRFGWADTRTRLSVNLVGGRAMRAREFAAARRGPILGASLSVVAPTGSYRSSRLVNLGSNRWSFKPELGVSVPAGRWTLE